MWGKQQPLTKWLTQLDYPVAFAVLTALTDILLFYLQTVNTIVAPLDMPKEKKYATRDLTFPLGSFIVLE